MAVPTLILWGRDDRVVDVRTATRFQQDIAGSQLVVIDHAGHSVHEEKPEGGEPGDCLVSARHPVVSLRQAGLCAGKAITRQSEKKCKRKPL